MENPFPSTVISDWGFLDSASGRSACPQCQKSRKYYCYTCYIALPHIADLLPKIQLPITVDIIKHPSEIDGKSTSPHAAVLAPDNVKVFTYPCIPDYDPQEAVLVFPCENSISLEDLKAKSEKKENPVVESACLNNSSDNSAEVEGKDNPLHCVSQDAQTSEDFRGGSQSLEERSMGRKRACEQQTVNANDSPTKRAKLGSRLPFQKVVFIDSTWNQTRNIVHDERLQNLMRVELKSQNTNFWRHQEGIPKSYLSTIEAIYYFIRDFHRLFIKTDYANEYDNLLFFFCYMYNKIKMSQNKGNKTKG